jgi:hypothetical protein
MTAALETSIASWLIGERLVEAMRHGAADRVIAAWSRTALCLGARPS